MKKIRQTFVCGLVCLALGLALSTCFNPLEGSGESSISITIGGSYGARTAISPNDLRHEIHLSGPQGQEITEYADYGETVHIEAELGVWKITVKAYSPDDPDTILATGEESDYEVRNGQPNAVTIQMHWAAGETFIVTFDTGGGSDVAKQRLLSGSLLDRPDNPTHASLGFVRWCSDDGLTTAFDFDDPVTTDITLYTLWSATIRTVSFASNGGTTVPAITVGDGGTITHPAEPTRTFTQTAGLYRGTPPNQYAFSGWYDGGTLFDFNSPITGDITLNAGWDEPLVDLSSVTGPDLHSKALTYVYGNPNTYTLLIDENISLAPQSLTAANTRLTLSSLGGPYTANLTGTGSLFTVNANTELALGNITLQGVTGNTAPLVIVNAGGAFAMSGGALVATGYEVYLAAGTTINVTGTLTNSRAARISLPDYAINTSGSGRQVLSGSAVSTEKTKFALSSPTEMWVASDGTLSGYIVSNLAGNGTAGFANGTGTAARFDGPCYLALDSAGNIYVTDSYNHQIRKITPNGAVISLAGGTRGFAEGTGAGARFDTPRGIAVNNYVYVADVWNHRIRRIPPNGGTVTTFSGSGTQGFQNGGATAARFDQPYGLALDSAGNVYVADFGNHRIRKITTNGTVSTLAGSGTAGFANGTGAAARFSNLRGVAVDSAGNVYVTDADNHRVRKITPSGVVTTLAGSGTAGWLDGPSASARFRNPYGIAVDSAGNVYVGDSGNNRIRKISPNGEVTTLAGDGTAGYVYGAGASARFNFPRGVAIDSAGNIYVADEAGNRIRKLTPGPR